MRNISFSLTTPQIRARTKDVTRRLKWLNLEAGDRLQACVKCMGRRSGEPLERLCVIEVVSVRREPLRRMYKESKYGQDECRREGFPELSPMEFISFFCESHGLNVFEANGVDWRENIVTRIEFRYVE